MVAGTRANAQLLAGGYSTLSFSSFPPSKNHKRPQTTNSSSSSTQHQSVGPLQLKIIPSTSWRHSAAIVGGWCMDYVQQQRRDGEGKEWRWAVAVHSSPKVTKSSLISPLQTDHLLFDFFIHSFVWFIIRSTVASLQTGATATSRSSAH